jgi:geranylgeranyl diphosphate synthase type II
MTQSSEFRKRMSYLREGIEARLQLALAKPAPTTLYEPMRYTLGAGGKRLRPLLLLTACEAVGGDYRSALDAAAAVELLHNFTLIHDDVMDNDDTRRGRATVHRKWDSNVAILAGDGLIALSYQLLVKTETQEMFHIGSLFSNTLLEVCEGQAYDKEFEVAAHVEIDSYLLMIRKKTAALLALCCELGGFIGGAAPAVTAGLREFGLNLGLGFQLQDDLFDLVSDEDSLGKTWGSDIRQKKKTMLLIHALDAAGPADRKTITGILAKPVVEHDDIIEIKAIFQRCGSIDAAKHLIRKHFDTAEKHLDVLPPQAGRQAMEAFLQTIAGRSS